MKKIAFFLLWCPLMVCAHPGPGNGSMTGDEKKYLLNLMDETGRYLLGMLEDVDEETWSSRMITGSWTIGECAEHILLSEQGILMQTKKLLEAPPVEGLSSDFSSHEPILTAVMDRVTKKAKTIEPLEPTNKWSTKNEFIDAYKKSRVELNDFIQNTEGPFHERHNKTPIGTVDLYQQLIVLAAHTSRHTMQIEELKAIKKLKTTSISFGGRTKVNTPSQERENVQKLFGDLLHLEIEKTEKYDRVLFDGGGFVVFFYHDNPENILAPEQFLNSMQCGLPVPAEQYESVRQRLKAFGVKEVYPEKDQQKYFYFHAPGGQVFRLVKKEHEYQHN